MRIMMMLMSMVEMMMMILMVVITMEVILVMVMLITTPPDETRDRESRSARGSRRHSTFHFHVSAQPFEHYVKMWVSTRERHLTDPPESP